MLIAGFTLSVVSVVDDASAGSNTLTSPGIIMKFCENPAMTLQDCNERYEGYTWTDRVNVLIYAPGYNYDDKKIDNIGKTFNGGNIKVSTRHSSSDEVVFSETGPNTGLFMGVVKLTGQSSKDVHDENNVQINPMGMNMNNYHTTCNMMQRTMGMCTTTGLETSSHDWAVKLKTDHQDGAVTVSWQANEDVNVVKSATWDWRLGEIEFTKEQFGVDEPITFKVHDADLWNHHAEFHTYYMRAWSDSDSAGIYVPVQFTPNHGHGEDMFYEGVETQLSEPASSSLTKYTSDGEYKTYFWWNPGGVIGVDKDYSINLMIHDGLTDIHQTHLAYGMEIWLNGELLETRTDRFAGDGHAVESIRFDERGTAKIVITDIFNSESRQDFSFQVAPEAIVKQVVGKHASFAEGNMPEDWKGRIHGHYVDLLEGKFYVTYDDSSSSLDTLRVSDGDSIYVEYTDRTLPKDDEGVFGGPYSNADRIEIKTQAFVFDHQVGMITP
jgi:hypothetical protein